jgi:hypothetical protein
MEESERIVRGGSGEEGWKTLEWVLRDGSEEEGW